MVVDVSEPTSLTDAYALMKVLLRQYRERHFHVLVNMVKSPRAARIYRKLEVASAAFSTFLDLGAIPQDDYVPMAVSQQRAVIDLFPHAPASRAFRELTEAVAPVDASGASEGHSAVPLATTLANALTERTELA